MARPTKTDDDRRSSVLKLRVTQGEFDSLKRDAQRTGQTVSEIARRKVLNESLTFRTTRRLPTEAYAELRRIGVNLNQIARRMNASGRADPLDVQIVHRDIDRLFDLLNPQDQQPHEPGPR